MTTTKFSSNSRRFPASRMTLIADISIPAACGTINHAIICSLLENKNKFVAWSKLERLVQTNLVQYGGLDALKKFVKKCGKKPIIDVIKDTIKKLSLSPTCFNNKTANELHERGVGVFLFSDGALAKTGGKCTHRGEKTFIKFTNGLSIQTEEDVSNFQNFRRRFNLVNED